MKRQFLVPTIYLTTGLVALGIVVGVRQGAENGVNGLTGGTVAVLAAVAFGAFLMVLFSTWALLSAALPLAVARPTSQREGLLGGILLGMVLVIGVSNGCVGDSHRSPLFVPLFLLNVVAVSAAFWFLTTCVGHVLTQERPALFKAFWVALLILGNLIAMPVYWCLYIWRPHPSLLSRWGKDACRP
jgi:hypothetical protein